MRSAWRPTRPMVRKGVLGLALLLVVGVGGPVGWDLYQDRREHCTDGVVKRGPLKECVGVTDGADGAYAYADHLKGVMRLIGEENEHVEGSGKKYVTLAYMTSFTVEKDDANSATSVRRELQGAYLAQIRANRKDLKRSPRVRLLVANTGSDSGQWKHTVNELIRLSELENEEERLLAVAGLGPSTRENKKALKRLSRAKIPMVGSIMTAVDLAGIEGLVRVPPTNREQAEAAARFLKEEGFGTSVIVQDVAPQNIYADSLAEEFGRAFPDATHRLLTEPLPYDTSEPEVWETQLYYSSERLCDVDPDVVYFAGRGKQLMSFLDYLANRTCQEKQFTVMTGDDTTNLTVKELDEAAERGVEVFYTGIAHPRMWNEDPTAVSKASADYFRDGGWMSDRFPSDPRDDGQAIVGHDATLTAIHAARMASHRGSPMTSSAVAKMLTHMHGDERVKGASGFLGFHNDGDPVDKALPIMELCPWGDPGRDGPCPSGEFGLRDVLHTETGG